MITPYYIQNNTPGIVGRKSYIGYHCILRGCKGTCVGSSGLNTVCNKVQKTGPTYANYLRLVVNTIPGFGSPFQAGWNRSFISSHQRKTVCRTTTGDLISTRSRQRTQVDSYTSPVARVVSDACTIFVINYAILIVRQHLSVFAPWWRGISSFSLSYLLNTSV